MSDSDVSKMDKPEEATVKTDATTPDTEAVSIDGITLNEVEELDPVQAKIDTLERSVEDWRARAYRSAADLENARKRFQRERDELKKFGAENLLKDLLAVVDNLERAVAHAEAENPLAEGVSLVLRQFTQIASNHGAKPFDAKGQPFDPQVHEAMTQVPTAEVEPGHVVDVFQRGWNLHGRLVRPAMVTVSIAPPSEEKSVNVTQDAEAVSPVEQFADEGETVPKTHIDATVSAVESNEVDSEANAGENEE